MQPNILLWTFSTTLFLGLGLFSIPFLDLEIPGPGEPSHGGYSAVRAQDDEGTTLGQMGKPVRLTIPRINVDAPVLQVGLDARGAMDIPKTPNDVAWLELGSRPGDAGVSVISGHYGWKDNVPAVFDMLHTLEKGDVLYVEDEHGVLSTFVVRESRTYDWEADATDVFISTSERSQLNLITCEGEWNQTAQSYSKRLVVFADKETNE